MMVAQEAICFPKPLVRVDFRFMTKNNTYWKQFVRDEHRARVKTGMIIPYQCTAWRELNKSSCRRGFPRATPGWSRIETPRGCNDELPPVFSFKPSALLSLHSGHWVIANTEMVCYTASFILQGVYDSLRLWAVSRVAAAFLRRKRGR